jgi:hypothetical protein
LKVQPIRAVDDRLDDGIDDLYAVHADANVVADFIGREIGFLWHRVFKSDYFLKTQDSGKCLPRLRGLRYSLPPTISTTKITQINQIRL